MITNKSKGRRRAKGSRKKTEKTRKTRMDRNADLVVVKDKPFKISSCSVNNKSGKNTCYNKDSLIYLRDNWNRRHKDEKILTDDEREIWNELKMRLRDT